MARTSRVVDGIDVVEDDGFGGERAGKTDDDEDRDIDKGVESYRSASEKVCGCGCTLARYQSCILTLIQNRIHLTLTTVAAFVIVKLILVVIYI